MAKWGEGDPRWIIEERADAKNVNNWHWTEKNATQWSIDEIKRRLSSFHIENDDFSCDSLNVTKCEGEANVNNRKGKLIFFYEWHIEADWAGQLKQGDNKTMFQGSVEIPNLSEEFSMNEVDVIVTCSSTSSDGYAIKEFMHTTGSHAVRELLGQYLHKLKAEYSKNLILPTKSSFPELFNAEKHPDRTEIRQNEQLLFSKQPKDLTVHEVTFSDEFFCTSDDLFKVLTTKDMVQAFTRGDATVDPVVNGKYVLYGGNIVGTFTALAPGKSIEMEWRKREWPEGHHSAVCINLTPFDGGTRLSLTQQGVPAYDVENTTIGWQSNFFASIKQTFGFGGRMF